MLTLRDIFLLVCIFLYLLLLLFYCYYYYCYYTFLASDVSALSGGLWTAWIIAERASDWSRLFFRVETVDC